MAVANEFDGDIDALEESLGVDAGEDEAALVEGFGALGARADAYGREGMANAGKEATLFGQGARVGDNGESIHLQAVVVVKAQGFVLDDALVELESAGFEALAGARMATVEDGHVVLLGHLVDGIEERQEVLLGVNVLLAVGGQQDIFPLFKSEALVDIGGLYFRQIVVQHFSHGAAGDVGALLGKARVGQVAARMFGVRHVHVGDDIHDAAVGLFGQTLVLAAVAGFHVEDGDMEALGPDDAEA